jgi:hypothetical protein
MHVSTVVRWRPAMSKMIHLKVLLESYWPSAGDCSEFLTCSPENWILSTGQLIINVYAWVNAFLMKHNLSNFSENFTFNVITILLCYKIKRIRPFASSITVEFSFLQIVSFNKDSNIEHISLDLKVLSKGSYCAMLSARYVCNTDHIDG